MNITPDLSFQNIHNPFTNEGLAYTRTNIVAYMYLNTKDLDQSV